METDEANPPEAESHSQQQKHTGNGTEQLFPIILTASLK